MVIKIEKWFIYHAGVGRTSPRSMTVPHNASRKTHHDTMKPLREVQSPDIMQGDHPLMISGHDELVDGSV